MCFVLPQPVADPEGWVEVAPKKGKKAGKKGKPVAAAPPSDEEEEEEEA